MGTPVIVLIVFIALFSVAFIIVFTSIISNKKSKEENLFERRVGNDVVLEPSQIVKSYKLERTNKPTYGIKLDRDGRSIVKYFVGDYIYKGEKCAYLESHKKYLEELLRIIYGEEIIKQNNGLLDSKIKELMGAQVNLKDKTVHIDLKNFCSYGYIFVFFFIKKPNDRFADDLYYFCKTRSINFTRLPETFTFKNHNNYSAVFNINQLGHDDLELLFYMLCKNNIHKSYNYVQSLVTCDCPNNLGQYSTSFDWTVNYFYKIIHDSTNLYRSFPDKRIVAEVNAREIGCYGWPRPYELATRLQNLYLEMHNSGYRMLKNKSEVEVFNLVKKLYPDAIYQYRTQWLGDQSLDIYVPSKKIAIEYQGAQHYKAVDIYGGKEGFETNKERDKQKQQVCKEHSVKIIEWPYSLKITESNAEKLLK